MSLRERVLQDFTEGLSEAISVLLHCNYKDKARARDTYSCEVFPITEVDPMNESRNGGRNGTRSYEQNKTT